MKAIYQSGFNIMGTGNDLFEAWEDAKEWSDNVPAYEDLETPKGLGTIHGEVYQANICPVLEELNNQSAMYYNLEYIDDGLHLVLDDEKFAYCKGTDQIVEYDYKADIWLNCGISESAITNRVSPLKEINTL